MYSAFLFAITSATVIAARTFTVKNNCDYTVWPAIFTDLNVAQNVPDHPTGWEAPPNTEVSFTVPDDWKAGRIWGRRDCDFSRPGDGANACVTGSCRGGLLCDPHFGTGVPPVTVAEWTLLAPGDVDYYDVSLVDGFNIPMEITSNVGCNIASCKVDLNLGCPGELLGPSGPNGTTGGCKSACLANLDGNQQDSGNCCSGSHNTPATCPPAGVAYYNFFKEACPTAYAYAFDEGSQTALWTCDTVLKADYTLTFCPKLEDASGQKAKSCKARR